MHHLAIITAWLIQTAISLTLPPLAPAPSLMLPSPNVSISFISPNSTIETGNVDCWPKPPFLFTWDSDHKITIAIVVYGATVSPLRKSGVEHGLQQIGRDVRKLGSADDQFWPQSMISRFVALVFNRSIRPPPQPYITIGEAADVVSALSYLTNMYGATNIARANIFSGQRLDMWVSLQVLR